MVESFARNETKVILIDGLRYEVTNGSDAGADFVYRKNGDTVEFISNMFSIKALDNASYNVALKGMNQKYYASDAGDTISSTLSAKIYGGAGDDSISVRGGYGDVIVHAGGGNDDININVLINNLYVDGGDGDDTITTLSNNSYGNAHILGGNGNDTFNLSESSGGFVDGGDGDDVFNISGSLYTLAGGSGNNTVNDTGTNNMYSNMSNADNTLTEIKFTSDNETKTINIGGIEYTIKNLVDIFGFYNNKEKAFTYGYNPATGEVVFGGCYFDITGESGKEHNISLYGSNNKLQTGTKNDTINIYGDANEIHAGSGDDTIIHNSSLTNTIYGEDGNDTIELNGRCDALVSGGNGDDEITIRGRANNVRGDAGNDTINIEYKGETTQVLVTDLKRAAAPIVRTLSGQSDPAVIINEPDGPKLYEKDGWEYVQIGSTIPTIQGETIDERLERIYNDKAFFVLGGKYKSAIDRIVQNIVTVNDSTMGAIKDLQKQLALIIQKVCE